MAIFELDPQSIVERVRATGREPHVPSFSASVLRGIVGFTVVSIAGFSPWPIIGRWFGDVGEMGLYVACTAVFIGLSGVCLHRLIIGPGSLSRFYKIFSLAFLAYAIVWVISWMWLRGDAGVLVGLLAGTVAMGAILALAFDGHREMLATIASLCALNAAGYYAGAWVHAKLGFDHSLAGMLLWGACYGIGFGAGLGVAFYLCQKRARVALAAQPM